MSERWEEKKNKILYHKSVCKSKQFCSNESVVSYLHISFRQENNHKATERELVNYLVMYSMSSARGGVVP